MWQEEGMCGRGACIAGGMCGRGCAWQGVCMVGACMAGGGACMQGGCAWQGGMCGRGCITDMAPWQILQDTVNERVVCILLEYILVFIKITKSSIN